LRYIRNNPPVWIGETLTESCGHLAPHLEHRLRGDLVAVDQRRLVLLSVEPTAPEQRLGDDLNVIL